MARMVTRILAGLALMGALGACSSNVNKIAALCQDLEKETKAAAGDCTKLAENLDKVFTAHKDTRVYGGPPTQHEMAEVQGPCLEAQKLIEPCRGKPEVVKILEKYQRKPQAP